MLPSAPSTAPLVQLNRKKLEELTNPGAGADSDMLNVTRGALRLLVASDFERRRLQAFVGQTQLSHEKDVA